MAKKIEQIPQSFIGPNFEKLIPPIQEKQKQFVFPFLRKYFELRILSAEDICEKINAIAQNLDSPSRMEIFHWWKTKFKENVDIKPVIVKTNQGDLIGDVDKCYLTGGAITDVPQWASITVIDSEDEKNLLNLYKDDIEREQKANHSSQKRILARFTGLREQSDLEQVVNDVNKSVKNGEHAKEFIGWLYRIYQGMPTGSKDKLCSNDSLIVPVAAGSGFCEKNKAYIGSAYGNSVGEPICEAVGLNPLIDSLNFLFDNENTALNFFEELRIVKYPKPCQVKCGGVPEYFEQFLCEKVVKPNNFKKWMDDVAVTSTGKPFNLQETTNCTDKDNSHVLSVENIKNIVNLQTKTILKWMLNDDAFCKAIDSDTDTGAKLFYELEKPQKAGLGACKTIDNVPNFLRYYLSTEKWIDINGAKQSIVSTTKDSIEFQSWYTELIAEDDDKKLPKLLQKLGLKEDEFSLSPEDFYKMLLDWSDKKEYSRKAVKLYSKIADPKNRESLTDKIQSSCHLKERFK